MARRVVFVLALVGLGLVLPASAEANGDPASDVLATRNVFVPGEFSPPPPTGSLPSNRVAQLRTLVGSAAGKGYPIKVALISAPVDLGLVYQLWRQPQAYANFLGQELTSYWNFRGRLLVVMPDGYGFYENGKPVKPEKRVLRALALPQDSHDIARAASVAVQRLGAEQGVKLELPPLPSSGKSSTSKDLVWITVGVFSVMAIAAVSYAWLRVRRRRRPA